jgi:DNA repair protein RecO (recombination protein O)
MPLRESEAVVLRSFPLGEADRIVSFFSRSFGRVRGVARGARRPKSRFGATLEPLTHVRIWYYERETRGLVRISQCELLESFLDTQREYAAARATAQVVEITEAVFPEHEVSDPAFRLLLATARGFRQSPRVEVPLAYFCLWTVRLSGWLPALERCGRCGRQLGEEAAAASPAQAGLACAKCRRPGMRSLSAASLAAARRMLSGRLEQLLAERDLAPPRRDLLDYLLDVIEFQIERKLTTRREAGAEPVARPE